jgi:hypothetical protein
MNCQSSRLLEINLTHIRAIKLMQDDQKDKMTRTWPKARYPIEVTTKVQNEQTA